ncbi:Uncharacterized protein DBV15_12003 [Temnothorax longispinosus]|uniref:Uncharacterized protein n=1 Tax=Temnothorax longispinosus TaxID=300112 RepID=A0A4S2KX95_9HYME|nr:Uncharacterized protein DBV15_12003 [Temnothorax longispinosus]
MFDAVHTQKLILFILRRSSKTFALNVGQIFVASLECFATVIIIRFIQIKCDLSKTCTN